MQSALQVKADVVNELRNKIYYNESEIKRLVENPFLMPHKKRVNRIVKLLEKNLIASSGIEMINNMIQNPPAPEEPKLAAPVDAVTEVTDVK